MTAESKDLGVPAAGAVSPSRGDENGREASVLVRVLLILGILAAGVASMGALVMLKEDPAEAKIAPRTISVETIAVHPEDVPVTVRGLGEVRSLNVVPLSPQVSGTVVEVHPHLERGEVIPAGELLFRIDPRDYEAALNQAAAQVEQLSQTVSRLEQQYAIDQERLKTLERSERLMNEEFTRVRTLFEEDEVGTRSAVDHAEMALNQASDARDQLAQAVTLYPARIKEARSGLDAARSQKSHAEINLARTEIRAEFDARLKDVKVELGQFVSPGMPVLTLADDRELEISVSLDSRDARDWLEFTSTAPSNGGAWFGELKPVVCKVSWTEEPEAHFWEGTLHRVESFDPATRTVSVAVRIDGDAARSSSGGLPLVEGMFCAVDIPGKVMKQVYRLPRWAVSYEGAVYLARDNQLAIQSVEVLRTEGDETFVRGDVNPGDTVITTRLVNPLPNTMLDIADEGANRS